jgi:hypothetical protein
VVNVFQALTTYEFTVLTQNSELKAQNFFFGSLKGSVLVKSKKIKEIDNNNSTNITFNFKQKTDGKTFLFYFGIS